METLLADIRFAFRSLRRTPAVTLVAIVTLALGIGANTAIFSVVNSVLFHPYPFLDGSRLTAVWSTNVRGGDHNEVSPADFRDFRASVKSFDHLVAHAWWTANFTGGDQPERIQGFRVSPDYFEALGVRPILGRSFEAGDDEPGHDRLVILSYGLWQRRFGGRPEVIGTTLNINGIPRVVVGVMPRGMRYPVQAEAWAPLQYPAEAWGSRQARFLLVMGRLAPGATVQGARAELAATSARLAAAYPASNTGFGSNVQPLIEDQTRMIRPMLVVLFAAVGFVLLIACANVANLMLARASGRRRELAIRTALGAARARISRLVLTESLLLAIIGGVAGVVVGIWGVDLLVALVPAAHAGSLAGLDLVRVDGPVLAFTFALALLSAVGFGIVPALRAGQSDPSEPLRGGAAAGGRERTRLRRGLVAAEVALALLLLVGAGLTYRTFRYLGSIEPGFDGDGVALTTVALGRSYVGDTAVTRFATNLLDRVAAIPGVRAAGTTNIVPMCSCNTTSGFSIIGGPEFPAGQQPGMNWRVVSPGYFASVRMPLKQGRLFSPADDAAAPRAAIVNETLSKRWFPNGGALGRMLYVDGDTAHPTQVVGIVGDIRHAGLSNPIDPEMYIPFAQAPSSEITVMARTDGDPSTLLPLIRRAVLELDHDQPVFGQQTLREVMSLAVAPYRFSMRLLAGLGVIALLLAGVGIYGVIAHLVSQRTREIGVRIALGGDQSMVRRLVVRQGMAPALLGLGVGIVLALGLARLMAGQVVGVSPRDPVTFVAVAAILMLVALAACWVPARRAARVDPMVALRSE